MEKSWWPWPSPWLFVEVLVSIQQQTHIFLSLPFATVAAVVPVVALFFALHVLCQTELPMSFGFLISLLHTWTVSLFLLGAWPMFPNSCILPFYVGVLSGAVCSSMQASFASQGWMDHSRSWRRWSLKVSQLSWNCSHGTLLSRSLKKVLSYEVYRCDPAICLDPPSILNSNLSSFMNLWCCGASLFFVFIYKFNWCIFSSARLIFVSWSCCSIGTGI